MIMTQETTDAVSRMSMTSWTGTVASRINPHTFIDSPTAKTSWLQKLAALYGMFCAAHTQSGVL
jgi:hypothetical protein